MVKTLPGVARRARTTTYTTYTAGTLGHVLVTNHVLSGAVIGALSRRVLPAFALGVLSHFALDAVPHWGKFEPQPDFMQVAVADGLAGLAVMGAMTAVAPREARAAVLAGMMGAALPDLDKPSKVFFGFSPFPRALDRFHARIQHEAPHRFPREAVTGAAMAATAVALLYGLRVRATTAG
jgi:hypothetical protein